MAKLNTFSVKYFILICLVDAYSYQKLHDQHLKSYITHSVGRDPPPGRGKNGKNLLLHRFVTRNSVLQSLK